MSLYKRLLTLFAMLSLAIVATTGFARQLPPGNYWKSCSQCHFNRNFVLSCRCRTANGFPNWTRLQVRRNCAAVGNANGRLMCTHIFHPRRPRPAPRRVMKRNFSAGPIYNQGQAQRVCPRICRSTNHFPRWTGQWNTTQVGVNSVCQCRR
jgi:hypothetical protein